VWDELLLPDRKPKRLGPPVQAAETETEMETVRTALVSGGSKSAKDRAITEESDEGHNVEIVDRRGSFR
jgi:hypothetical protein